LTAQSNTMWQSRVRKLLREGFGSEDIGVRLGYPAEDVRQEIALLRANGDLKGILAKVPWGPTAKKMMVRK
jgi:hypothetical protein